METKKENQALTAPAPLTDDYRQIAHLIGSIFFAGDFKAETANERELEALLIKTGHRYASWDEVVAQAAPAPQQSELSEQLEAIARTWDGHLTEDSHGEEFDIGRDLRNDFAKLNLAKAAPAAPVQHEVDIDTPEFMDLLYKFAHEASCEEFIEAEYSAARKAIIDHIKLAKVAAPVQIIADARREYGSLEDAKAAIDFIEAKFAAPVQADKEQK